MQAQIALRDEMTRVEVPAQQCCKAKGQKHILQAMEGKLVMHQNELQASDQATDSCLHVDAGQRVMLVTCLLPLLVQLVDEERVEEVALWVALQLAHLHITLLQVIAEMSLHACSNALMPVT